MTRPQTFALLAALLTGVVLFLYGQLTALFAWTAAGLLLTVVPALLFLMEMVVFVPEHVAVVVQHVGTDRYSRFLENGLHLLSPFERVVDRLNLMPLVLNDTVSHVRSRDGVPFTVTYDATLQPDLNKIERHLLPTLVKMLSKALEPLMQARLDLCLRQLLGEFSAAELSQGDLVSHLRTELKGRLAADLTLFGVDVYHAVVLSMNPPPDYQRGLTQAQARRLETAVVGDSLRQLRDVLQTLPERDKLLLTQWEQLRTLVQGNNTLVYLHPQQSQLDANEQLVATPLPPHLHLQSQELYAN